MLFGGQNVLTNLYNNQMLRLWGKFSFGIYLFHFVPVKLMHEIKDSFASNIDPLVISLVLSQLIGYVWFHVCEQPLLDIANRLCRSLADKSCLIQTGKVDEDQKIIGL
jgi:peptidoglycan/LPS O-acetylase OafA/YrhL